MTNAYGEKNRDHDSSIDFCAYCAGELDTGWECNACGTDWRAMAFWHENQRTIKVLAESTPLSDDDIHRNQSFIESYKRSYGIKSEPDAFEEFHDTNGTKAYKRGFDDGVKSTNAKEERR